MIYCDTSLLIAVLTTEIASPLAQRWLHAQALGTLAISPWVDTEFASAVAIKGRIGTLDADERARVLAEWQFLQRSFHVKAVETRHLSAATKLVGYPGTHLRGSDALHLAIAQDYGFALVTLDHDLAVAAAAISVSVIDPLEP